MTKQRDRLISTGGGNVYFLLVTLLVTLTGFMYILGILPAYDPAVLAQPPLLTYLEYLGLATGGSLVFISFILPDKLYSLWLQFLGLAAQTSAALFLGLTVILYGGFSSLFIAVFSALLVAMHGHRMLKLSQETQVVDVKRAIAEAQSGDDLLEIVLFLQARNEELEQTNSV